MEGRFIRAVRIQSRQERDISTLSKANKRKGQMKETDDIFR